MSCTSEDIAHADLVYTSPSPTISSIASPICPPASKQASNNSAPVNNMMSTRDMEWVRKKKVFVDRNFGSDDGINIHQYTKGL